MSRDAALYDRLGVGYRPVRRPDPRIARGLDALAADLASGRWHARYADLCEREALDLGYRIVVARPG
ncbi:MAG: hypothetical protein KIT14_14795 [bacterium]|nr:hypothetical protein [bacterium]